MKTKKNLVKLVLMSIVTVATVFGFTACSEDTLEESYGMAEKKAAADKSMSIGRTVLIYMAGKNDLTHNNNCRNYVNEDLEEIKEGSRKLSSNDCLLVFVRRYLNGNNLETPWLARIQNGEVTDSVSVRDMGIMKEDARACDPEVMEQVMHYAYTNYPATRDYGLVLWSHSTGWLIESEVATTRGYGVDNGNYVNGSGKWINIPTMKNVLAKMPHLKFIMADCCHFMCLESLYELRSVTDYVIGSPAEIPGLGAPYKEVVSALFESDYQQWKQALDKAVVLKRIGYRWDTANIWRYAFVDFEMTEEKFHGVSMFIPQAPTIGEYAKMNEDIKQMEWAGAISLL